MEDSLPEHLTVIPMKRIEGRKRLVRIVSVLSFGLYIPLKSIYPWLEHWEASPALLDEATLVMVSDEQTGISSLVHLLSVFGGLLPFDPPRQIRYFRFEAQLYYFCPEAREWRLLLQPFLSRLLAQPGLPNEYMSPPPEAKGTDVAALYGPNLISVQMPPFYELIWKELASFETAYQIGCVVIWTIDEYYLFSAMIVIMLFFYVLVSALRTRRNTAKLQKMAHFRALVEVRRNGSFIERCSTELRVGDVVRIRGGERVPCDVLLMRGRAVVDEALLTGESAAVMKYEYDGSIGLTQSYVLYGGTLCTSSHYGAGLAEGIVFNTGYNTAKGSMIRAMLVKRTDKAAVDSDYVRFLFSLFALSIAFAIIFSLQEWRKGLLGPFRIFIRASELATSAVPATLSFYLLTLNERAISKLRREEIYTFINRLTEAARLRLICFDKTGTLTENRLRFCSAHVVERGAAGFRELVGGFPAQFTPDADSGAKLHEVMSSCHSIFYLEGELQGDPLEVEMFAATGSTLTQAEGERILDHSTGAALVMRRRIDFTSYRKRFSVIVFNETVQCFELHVKGSTAVMRELCRSESVPADYFERVQTLSNNGLRVLAAAARRLAPEELSLEATALETRLDFVGLIAFENEVKTQTRAVLDTLWAMGIESRIISGDDPLTCIAVGKRCNLMDYRSSIWFLDYNGHFRWTRIPSENDPAGIRLFSEHADCPAQRQLVADLCQRGDLIAMTGDAAQRLGDGDEWIFQNCTIFGKANPDQKALIIRRIKEAFPHFRDSGHYIGFCGDGANDCQALKYADVGFSLGQFEASVAAAFNSTVEHVGPVLALISTSKAFASSTVQTFEAVVLAGFFMFALVFATYSIDLELPTAIFLNLDFALYLPIFPMLANLPKTGLNTPDEPPARLFSPLLFARLALGLAFLIITTVLLTLFITARAAFLPAAAHNLNFNSKYADIHYFHEPYYLFLGMVCVQIVSITSIYSGHPFKCEWYQSPRVLLYLCAYALLNTFTIFPRLLGAHLSDSVRRFVRSPEWAFGEFASFAAFVAFLCAVTWIFYTRFISPLAERLSAIFEGRK